MFLLISWLLSDLTQRFEKASLPYKKPSIYYAISYSRDYSIRLIVDRRTFK